MKITSKKVTNTIAIMELTEYDLSILQGILSHFIMNLSPHDLVKKAKEFDTIICKYNIEL